MTRQWQLWAAAGTNGKDGATGATGPQGPQGPQGIPGTIPLTPTFTSITLSGPGAATLTCPRGTIWKLDGPMLSCVSGGTP